MPLPFVKLSQEESRALRDVAETLGIRAEWLYDLIQFESGWDPGAHNPKSGARGLIQFMPKTAEDLGYGVGASAADSIVVKYPSRVAQLYGPVSRYLLRYYPFPTFQSLLMAVFYPKYRSVPEYTQFPPTVQRYNPGIKTVADYIRKVRYAAGRSSSGSAIPFVLFAAVAGGLWYIMRSGGAYGWS